MRAGLVKQRYKEDMDYQADLEEELSSDSDESLKQNPSTKEVTTFLSNSFTAPKEIQKAQNPH